MHKNQMNGRAAGLHSHSKWRRWMLAVPLLMLTVWLGCSKTDNTPTPEAEARQPTPSEERFFHTNRSARPVEEKIVAFLRHKNSKTPFVEQTVRVVGWPQWKAMSKVKGVSLAGRLVGDTAGGARSIDELYALPFVRDSQQYVNATMLIAISRSDTLISYMCDWQYRDTARTHVSKKDFALFMMRCDASVFGYRWNRIKDSTLFGRGASGRPVMYVRMSKGNAAPTGFWAEVISCHEEAIPTKNGQLAGCPPGVNCPQYDQILICDQSQLIWVPDGPWTSGSSEGNGNGGGSGGSGGDGNGPAPMPCPGQNSGRGLIRDDCGAGWEPQEDPEEGDGIAKIRTISNQVQNPCLRAIVNKFLNSSAKAEISNLVTNRFGASKDFHLVFFDSSFGNINRDGRSLVYTNSNGRIEVNVFLNLDVLPDASQEFTMATIFHEVIHGYLASQGMTDDLNHHNYMGLHYVDQITNSLLGIFPALTQYQATSMAWGGLEKSQAYKDSYLSDSTRMIDMSIKNSFFRVSTLGTPCP